MKANAKTQIAKIEREIETLLENQLHYAESEINWLATIVGDPNFEEQKIVVESRIMIRERQVKETVKYMYLTIEKLRKRA